jgi:hypothetical protein
MSKGKASFGLALAATLVVAGAVVLRAGTTYSKSVSGISKGATVSVQGEIQCPQGRQCQPQVTATLTVTWDSGKSETSTTLSLEKGSSEDRLLGKGACALADLPAGRTFNGNLELNADIDVTFTNVKASVSR